MMKRFSLLTLLASVLLILWCSGCQKVTYQGEYTTDGYYGGSNGIYFHFRGQGGRYDNTGVDTELNASFGGAPETYIQETIEIPVRVLGRTSGRSQKFKVEADPTSTAVAGVNYQPLKETYEIAPNASEGVIPIVILRNNLQEEDEKGVKLILHLVSTDELKVEFAEENKISITWNNFLEKPNNWEYFVSVILGPYTIKKHKKLIELLGGYDKYVERNEMYARDPSALYIDGEMLRRYYRENPDPTQTFPDNPSVYTED